LEHPADFFESQGSDGNFVGGKPTILNTRVQHTDKQPVGLTLFSSEGAELAGAAGQTSRRFGVCRIAGISTPTQASYLVSPARQTLTRTQVF